MEKLTNTKYKTVEEYILNLPPKTKNILNKLRKTIRKAAPKAEEVISYNMPAFKLNGILVWFAVHKEHIGFYPRPSAIEAFKKELSEYVKSKGTVQFPIDKPLPFNIIEKLVKFRVNENLSRTKTKRKNS